MKKKNSIIILIIILIIVLSVFYIFSLENNNHEINDKSYNNSSNVDINKSIDKNSTVYLNSTVKTVNFDNNINNNVKSVKNKNCDNKNSTNKSIDGALEAKLGVEKYVLNKNEFAGYPVYKYKDGSWLVPIFDKKTKKFKGSVYIYKGGAGFVMGPQSYSEYKEIVYGKTTHKSDSNKHVKTNKSNNKSYDLRKVDIVGKYNPDILTDPMKIIDTVQEQLQKQHEKELIQNQDLNSVSDASESSSQEHVEIGEYDDINAFK